MPERTRPGLTIGTKALIGLALGLAIGAAIARSHNPALLVAGSAIEVAGQIWINAILMTIIPLVVSKLVVSIAGNHDAGALGRAGWQAGSLFLLLLTGSAVVCAAVMPTVFARLQIDAGASAALRASAGVSTAAKPPGIGQTIVGLVPGNAIRAAADGAIVPLLVFTIAFAVGASRIPASLRDPLVTVFRAIDAAITVVLHWIIELAPYGVFALGLGLAIRVGVGIVTALVFYVVVSSVAQVMFTAALYVIVLAGAGVSPRRFAAAAAPSQVVAFGTHSSMAALPAMIEGAETRLALSPTSTGFVLPLALAVFKYSAPIWFVVVAHFVARLYGAPIDFARSVATVIASVVTSFAVGGVPSGAAVVVAPVLTAAGLPVEAVGILLAVDPIPNAFRTVANVTGMLAVATLTDGGLRRRPRRASAARADAAT